MAIFYLDYVNGSDANDGTSWATAWRTITTGATSARIAPGDIIRIAKSPPPSSIGNATWTNLSKTVTLATSQTATISLCETAWTAAANVTATTSTTRKQGANACSLAIAAAFTTGKVAHTTISAINLSSYQRISFWIRNNAAIAAGRLSLVLCSDTAGNTIVDTFPIPAIPSTDRYLPLTISRSGGGNLGSSIQSVALYADIDPGEVTVLLDNIIACTADGLNLQSLISKSSAEQGGNEAWYAIQSIVDTTVLLDNGTNTLANEGRGYWGTTETVETYKRETIKTDLAALSTTAVQTLQRNGTLGNNIQYQGGFNTSTNEQDGETFFDGLNGFGIGINMATRSYTTLNYISVFRYNIGIQYGSNSHNNLIDNLSNANNNSSYGVDYNASYNNRANIIRHCNNSAIYGIRFVNSSGNLIDNLMNANNNMTSGVFFDRTINNVINAVSNANNNGSQGVIYHSSADNIIRGISTANNASSSVRSYSGAKDYLYNANLAEAVEFTVDADFSNSWIFSHRNDNTVNNHFAVTVGGRVYSQTAVRRGDSGIAWRVDITSTLRSSAYPLRYTIARIACNANALVTVKAWMRRTNTGLTMMLVCPGLQIPGVDNDVSASMTAAADTWQELTITFTPSEAGVVQIECWAYGGTTFSGFIDDISVTQA